MATLLDSSLISLSDFKAHVGVTTTTDDGIISDCLNMALGLVEARCDRRFLTTSTEVVEWHKVRSGISIQLKQWPVIALRWMAWGSRPAMTVRLMEEEESTYLAGTVTVTETGVTVRKQTSGDISNSTALYVNYDTVSELVTQLDSIDGVTATVINNGPCALLIPSASRDILETTVTLEAAEYNTADHFLDVPRGMVHLKGEAWDGVPDGRVQFAYTAGYATTADVPPAARTAQVEIASRLWVNRRRDTGSILDDGQPRWDMADIGPLLDALTSSIREIR